MAEPNKIFEIFSPNKGLNLKTKASLKQYRNFCPKRIAVFLINNHYESLISLMFHDITAQPVVVP